MAKKKLATVFHFDLFGKRKDKYEFLNNNSINSIQWNELENKEPYFFFVPKDFELLNKFNKGINLRELFTHNSMGIATGKDAELVDFEKENLFNNYNIKPIKFYYRPFDIRFTIFDNRILQRARFNLMSNYLRENIGLNIVRQSKQKGIEVLINKTISNRDLITNHTYNFPLYRYSNKKDGIFTEEKRKPNLNQEIVNEIAEKLGLDFVGEKIHNSSLTIPNSFAPIDILDYIYAVLHSPTYREKYKEFLKIDFPRVPYPKDKKTFWSLVKLGKEVRQIHLLESKKVEDYITSYPKDGDNTITTKISKKDWELFDAEKQLGRIWINETQYFDNIPVSAWEFYIGGYQPAQKWLKDRKERELKFEDIMHYQKIIVALSETDRIMKEINTIEIE